MKKNKFITVYSIIVSAIFVVTIVMFGAYLYKEYSTGYVRTRKTFDAMNVSVKNTLQTASSNPIDLYSKIENSVGTLEDYFYLDVKKNGKSIFTYSPKGTVPTENTNMIKLYYNTSKIDDDTIYINAAMYTLRPTTIAGYAKIAFIVILIFTIITIVLIIYVNMKLNSSDDIISYTENEDDYEISDEPKQSEETNVESVEIKQEPENIESSEQTTIEQPTIETNTIVEEAIEEENQQTEQPTEKAELPINDVKPTAIETVTDKGLFSPETGFGWESYLQTRLENEIERATSLEFDLILMLIKIKDISRNSDIIQEISPVLINEFQFRDLIFEYKDDCFAAIKTNCSIDDAIPLADKLHTELSKIISDKGGKCYIGLTSRTIRLVSGERLLKEAEAALEHAQEDEDSPIIAFRANTEKYLEFIDRQ